MGQWRNLQDAVGRHEWDRGAWLSAAGTATSILHALGKECTQKCPVTAQLRKPPAPREAKGGEGRKSILSLLPQNPPLIFCSFASFDLHTSQRFPVSTLRDQGPQGTPAPSSPARTRLLSLPDLHRCSRMYCRVSRLGLGNESINCCILERHCSGSESSREGKGKDRE